jgi:hypothetical protein
VVVAGLVGGWKGGALGGAVAGGLTVGFLLFFQWQNGSLYLEDGSLHLSSFLFVFIGLLAIPGAVVGGLLGYFVDPLVGGCWGVAAFALNFLGFFVVDRYQGKSGKWLDESFSLWSFIAIGIPFFIGPTVGLILALLTGFSPLGLMFALGCGSCLLCSLYFGWRSSALRAAHGPLPWWAIHEKETEKTFRGW